MPGSYPSVQSFFRREACLKDVQPMEGYASSSLVEGGGVEGNLRGGGNEKEDGVRIGGNGYGIGRLEDGRGKVGDGFGDEFLRDTSGEGDEVVEKRRDGDLGRGDGFTEEELTEAMDPLARKWNPGREYENLEVGELVCGPKAVTFIGRVVSFATVIGKSAKQPRARGWHYVGVRGEGGVVSVKLYFANQHYPLKLGQLLSIWTAFISDISKADGAVTAGILVCANLFPGRNTSDHLMIHTHSGAADICRIPLGYKRGEALPGLMTVEAYLNGGYDGVVGVKLLICVKRIGAKKKIIRKDGGESNLIEVTLFDHTAEIKMKCWSDLIESVKEWQSGKTILLFSNPVHKLDFGGKSVVSFGRNTYMDVDPEFPDAQWLRNWARKLLMRERVGVRFPQEIWGVEEVEEAMYGPRMALFGLRDVDEWVREGEVEVDGVGGGSFTGWISVVILDMALLRCWRRNMLMYTECCGIPLYANSLTRICPHCSKTLNLILNPKIIGTLIDETGCIAAGKLIWSDNAWEDLLGRSVNQLCEMSMEEVRLLEWRMVGGRVSLCFGWVGGEWGVGAGADMVGGGAGGGETGGRLCILGVRS